MTTCEAPVLYVDDDVDNVELFKLQFENTFPLRTATSGERALAILAREPIGVLLADEQMPGMSGTDLLAQAVLRWPYTVRVIVSAYSDPPRLLRAINRGHACEYIVKPWLKPELTACIERGLAIAERCRALTARAEISELYERDAGAQYDTARVVGEASGLSEAIALAHRAARSDATLLITGETGTGKELIARLVHEMSPRRTQPFVRVNCAALAEGVLESELFGHEQGAFTGALRQRKGRFELAHCGTIFLDEIGEISAKVQALLLRVLAATHRDLHQLVRAGRFREDLYYRLNVVPLHVPALRHRKCDIRSLVEHFLVKHSLRSSGAMPVDPEVYEALETYAWPGNVRELENLVQRALVLARGPELTVEDFTFNPEDASAARPMFADGTRSLRDDLKDEERRRILSVLEQCQRNQSKAAKLLGMPRRTLVERLRSYGVSRRSKE